MAVSHSTNTRRTLATKKREMTSSHPPQTHHVVNGARDLRLRHKYNDAHQFRVSHFTFLSAVQRATYTSPLPSAKRPASQKLPVSSDGLTHPHGVAVGRGPDSSQPRMATDHRSAHLTHSSIPLPVSMPGACAVAAPAGWCQVSRRGEGGARAFARAAQRLLLWRRAIC